MELNLIEHVSAIEVGGIRFERVVECEKLPQRSDSVCVVQRLGSEALYGYWTCSNCGCECFECAKYCMNCGAKAVGE